MRDFARSPRLVLAAATPLVTCTGCHMLGAIFHEHAFGAIAFVVVVVAAVMFLALKAQKR